jgi:hypothetical protein
MTLWKACRETLLLRMERFAEDSRLSVLLHSERFEVATNGHDGRVSAEVNV